MINSFSQVKISINSSKVSIAITSIQGIIDASSALSFGINIFVNHFSFAEIVAGRTEFILLTLQSRANSQRKIDFSIKSSFIKPQFKRIQIAIAKSKLGQLFFISAGAKLTVILFIGSLFPADFSADFNLCLLSWIP